MQIGNRHDPTFLRCRGLRRWGYPFKGGSYEKDISDMCTRKLPLLYPYSYVLLEYIENYRMIMTRIVFR